MGTTTPTKRKYRNPTTNTRPLREAVFEELTELFAHTAGFLKSAAEAADHLRQMLRRGHTLWSLAVVYLL